MLDFHSHVIFVPIASFYCQILKHCMDSWILGKKFNHDRSLFSWDTASNCLIKPEEYRPAIARMDYEME